MNRTLNSRPAKTVGRPRSSHEYGVTTIRHRHPVVPRFPVEFMVGDIREFPGRNHDVRQRLAQNGMLKGHEAEMDRYAPAATLLLGCLVNRAKVCRHIDQIAAPCQQWSELPDDKVVGIARASQISALCGMAGVRREDDAGG